MCSRPHDQVEVHYEVACPLVLKCTAVGVGVAMRAPRVTPIVLLGAWHRRAADDAALLCERHDDMVRGASGHPSLASSRPWLYHVTRFPKTHFVSSPIVLIRVVRRAGRRFGRRGSPRTGLFRIPCGALRPAGADDRCVALFLSLFVWLKPSLSA